MRKFFGFKSLFLLVIILMPVLYIFGTKNLDKYGRVLFFDLIVRNIVQDKSLLTQNRSFCLGLYRPEIPYDFNTLFEIEDSLDAKFTMLSFYQAWGGREEHKFPLDVCKNLSKSGFIPLITWEPWIVAFDGYNEYKPDSSLKYIIDGAFDWYIREWARSAVRYGKPLFLRPGHEMSNGWYSWSSAHQNSPEMYKQFWSHVYHIFKQEGAKNVAFVWNPFVSQDTVFYPGDSLVDWIGLDIFNYGTYSVEGTWMDFYNVTKLLYDQIKSYGKPVLIAETGTVSAGGNKPNWYRDMFHYLAVKNFPLIKGLVIFDLPNAKTPTGITVDLSMSTDPTVYSTINKYDLFDSLHIKTESRCVR